MRNQEPDHGSDKQPPRRDTEIPDLDDLPIGKAHDVRDDAEDDLDDDEDTVVRRPAGAPLREDDEEELSEADIMEELDLDDLKHMEGPDA